ncbi:uncharacterized protein B0I36DRAFT_313621 [Microdochium trichocladiopsis]|uniref:DUF7728 domain-containing protein n=1 Tax=Microdochium trichocladiopsis TaxID=1682393 RepID=A0A9P8YDB8_9PEZI|nr:uncharacterized protein B0I36DRAFT_313621 [Microdochium trichocladiopsis]KAH7037248.1 hypothetical protein B0I36DRAFT_313621 [Microdochium trichocladiopsis]
MQLTSLIAAGLAVASTNAILLPPDVSIADEDTFSILPHPTSDDLATLMAVGKETSINLNCPGCPVRKHHRNGKVSTHTAIASHLELAFVVQEVDGQDALLINGLPVFPDALAATYQPLTARLVPDFKKKNHDFVQHNEPEVLGFGIVTRPVHADSENAMELFAVYLQIIEVGGIFVQGIQAVEALVIKTPENKLMLVEVNVADAHAAPTGRPSSNTQECSSLLCQVKNMFKGIFSDFGIKPCSKNKSPVMTGEIVGDADEGMREGHHRPEHHRHGHGYGHHGPKHHSWGHLLTSIATDILFPIAFGVFAGVTASVIGMMVGTFIVHVWRVCVRGGGRCPRRLAAEGSHKAATEEVVAEDEKVGLMAQQEEDIEAPPAYDNKTAESK